MLFVVMCSNPTSTGIKQIDGIDGRAYYNIRDMVNSGFTEVTTVRNDNRLNICVVYSDGRDDRMFKEFYAIYEKSQWLSLIKEEDVVIIQKSIIHEIYVDTISMGEI